LDIKGKYIRQFIALKNILCLVYMAEDVKTGLI